MCIFVHIICKLQPRCIVIYYCFLSFVNLSITYYFSTDRGYSKTTIRYVYSLNIHIWNCSIIIMVLFSYKVTSTGFKFFMTM